MHTRGSLLLERAAGIALAAALGVVGCAPGDVGALYPVPRPLGQDIPAFRAGPDPAQPTSGLPAVEEPTETLTLRQALMLALARNPDLAAASWEVRAAEARALQAGLTPNPEVRVRMADFGGTGDFEGTKDSEQRIRLSQVIELAGKAAKRRRAARSEAALCGWDYETERLDVFARTTKAFVAALAAQERVAAAQEMLEQAEQVMALVSKRVKGGAASEIEADEARIALGTSRIDLARARQALDAARGVLAGFWDADKPTFRQVAGRLADPPSSEVPALEPLLERLSGNPDVARWETEAQMRQAALELEQANPVPNLRVLLETRRMEDTGDHGYAVALEMSLPVFDRNQGGIWESRFKRIRAAHQRRAALMAAAAALRKAYQALSASHQEAALLRDVIVPAARNARDVTRRALERGAATDLQLLKAQRTLFRSRTQQIDALKAYHLAVADVERLTAHPLGAAAAPKQPQAPPEHRAE